MKNSPYHLNCSEGEIVLAALHEVCCFRRWNLLAAHVRTSHVHVVAGKISDANRAIADFKAYASRALNLQSGPARRWAREGSTRPLRTREAIQEAIRYVVESQGKPMAVYVGDSL
jgi:REP element-mobilizing transposase RayT